MGKKGGRCHETKLEQISTESDCRFVREAKSRQHGAPLLWRFVHRWQLQSHSENRQRLQVGVPQRSPLAQTLWGSFFQKGDMKKWNRCLFQKK